MQPLENKNDKTAHNNDKRSFIPFKRSKQPIKCFNPYRKSVIRLLGNTLKKPDPVSPVRQPGYTCFSHQYPITISFNGASPFSFHHQGHNIYALNPELS